MLILPISDLVGLINLHVGLLAKFGLWSFNVMNASLSAVLSTLGSYDGAETCELVGNFLLSQLQHLDINMGLYQDDGLAIINATPRQTENIKKEI